MDSINDWFVNGECFLGAVARPALRAMTGAALLLGSPPKVQTQAFAALCTGSCRPSVKAATLIIQTGDAELITDVLTGRRPLLATAAEVRNRALLMEAFRTCDQADIVAAARMLGPEAIFDQMVVPVL
jgi:hypothetical protein